MAVIKEYVELIIACLSLLSTIVVAIVFYVKRFKAIKNAKTAEEKENALNDIKAKTIGLINVAERLFADIPKSGSSKQKYVLDHVKDICTEMNVLFDDGYWGEFINNIIDGANAVIDEKEIESEKAEIIERVKNEVPYFVDEADKLFSSIPDSQDYKIEYILKAIATACEKFSLNVYNSYDWRAFVLNFYNEKSKVGV